MSSENVQKGQVKMYNFGGSIFRDIHQGYTSSSAALDESPVICICITTRRRKSPPVTTWFQHLHQKDFDPLLCRSAL